VTLIPSLEIAPGVSMPTLGLGVFRLPDDEEGVRVVHEAIDVGFRHIDTATFYGNEQMTGAAVRTAPLDRSDLFVVTKVWSTDQGYDGTLRAFEASLERMGLDSIDLYMLHWPVDRVMAETWRAMERLLAEGRVRAIGVSNFKPRHLDVLASTAEVPPAVNQIELNPFNYGTQRPIVEATRRHGVTVVGYRPFANGAKFDHPVAVQIGEAHGKSAAQVYLRWQIDHGTGAVPGWAPRDLMVQNLDVFDFSLTAEQVAALDALDEGLLSATPPPDASLE
jgi:2,5-diketo-D-gluconate reductase A